MSAAHSKLKSVVFGSCIAYLLLLCSAAHAQVIWERSYQAGSTDTNGAFMGGSQMMHLVPYKDSLYAGLSYWMDDRNDYLYGAGTNVDAGWGQILRLDSSDGEWEVDFEMGAYWLRPETLKEVIFTTDSNGIALAESVSFLFPPASMITAYSKQLSKLSFYTCITGIYRFQKTAASNIFSPESWPPAVQINRLTKRSSSKLVHACQSTPDG